MKTPKSANGGRETVPVPFELENFLPYRLSVTSHRVARLFAAQYATQFGLTIPEWRVLAVIGRFGTCSPTAVGEFAAMDKVKVSRAAAALVAKGFLRQSQDPNDGRGRLPSMTRKGLTVHTDVVPLARGIEATLADGLTKAEWATLNKALQKLSAHVGDLTGPDVGGATD
jgi:DNA-binding MarR family transcriptional regulator